MCLQLVLCPFYVNFVVFLSFLEIICLPAGRVDICAIWRFALHKIFQIRMCVFNKSKKKVDVACIGHNFSTCFFSGCLAIVYLLQLLLFLTHFFYFSFSFQVFYDFMCIQGKMQFLPCFAYHLLNMNEINSKKSHKVHECTHFGLMLFFLCSGCKITVSYTNIPKKYKIMQLLFSHFFFISKTLFFIFRITLFFFISKTPRRPS